MSANSNDGPSPQPAPKPNQLGIRATIHADFAGIDLGYRRGLGRHFSVGGSFEYLYPRQDFGRIVSLGQTVAASVWVQRPMKGPFLLASFSVAETLLAQDVRLATISVAPGGQAGWGFQLPFDLAITVSGGFRRQIVVSNQPAVCTLDVCPYVREQFLPRFELTFAWGF